MPPRSIAILAAAPLLGLACCGCVVVGYNSRSGWFLWPPSIVFLILLLFLILALRHRR